MGSAQSLERDEAEGGVFFRNNLPSVRVVAWLMELILFTATLTYAQVPTAPVAGLALVASDR